MRAYATVFNDWQFVDLPPEDAATLCALLVEMGAGFACTSEPAIGRRVYFASPTSTRLVTSWLEVKANVTDQYAKAAADNYETMLDTDRPLSSRREDFERISRQSPEIRRPGAQRHSSPPPIWSCPGSPTGRHGYDDDGVLYPEWASNYPGSKPGDPCIHCDHEKLEEESGP